MRRRFLYSIPSIVILGLVSFVLAKGAVKIILKEEESRKRVEDLQAEVATMALREETLKRSIERLETPEGIEDEIKDKFGVVREGEHVAIIVDEKRAATSTDDSSAPWYKRFWGVIIGK
ncbi:MAG: hypothetical protein A2832_02105 [Candidatus Zambryskibacteria bacterium RIFCSPHIGHO2_01_FULL_44_22b]|uniref:Septum formation initiator n=1 Tax=Candidatus Zambryskibacteria bacterium RIFCSPHIGHO2_01_FULL_44_22b TaxID=1802737 RepID=A0A1G2SXY9_9BACT|nr:MAG: hypothetical protein A2832_02105 [Candidatus Zambryskibacteria bacterium RIFCSPHIGHO2_01_FULL_44_22b]